MKCPKCGYLGFEQVDRCRNCGYEFSLAQPPPLPELIIRPEGPGPVVAGGELALTDATATDGNHAPRETQVDLSRQENLTRGSGTTPELPLFARAASSDVPLIAKPSAPRAPLAVRRATPDLSRLRGERRASGAALSPESLDLGVPVPTPGARSPVPDLEDDAETEDEWEAQEPAGLTDRLLAALVDALILAATDLIAVYFTLQICGLPVDELSLLPKRPLIAFLALQNGGYLVAFTATSQTLGKLAAGIRVVSAASGESPGLKLALVRTLLWVVLAAPAGLGFLTALFSRDGRGLHDRGAGTRVVRTDV